MPVRRSRRTSSSARSALLAARARELRFALTPSESALWAALRGGRLGVPFRRQVVVADRFIADFLAPQSRLIVEVDGGYHAERSGRDDRRDAALERAGYRVLRLPAELVLRDLATAVARVLAALRA